MPKEWFYKVNYFVMAKIVCMSIFMTIGQGAQKYNYKDLQVGLEKEKEQIFSMIFFSNLFVV